MASNPRERIEARMREMAGVGCQIAISLGAANRLDIAERLEPALPPGWEMTLEFHRTTDNGHDLYFHTIETFNDRIDIPTLEEFGDRFSEIRTQLNIERAREESPGVFEDAVERLGRQEALEFLGDLGVSDDRHLDLFARPLEATRTDVDAEVLLRAKFGAPMTEGQMDSIVRREFIGEFVMVEPASQSAFFLGGSLARDVGQVRRTLDALEEQAPLDRDGSSVVCRVTHRVEG